MQTNRRKLLQLAAAGAAGATLPMSFVGQAFAANKRIAMVVKNLGNTYFDACAEGAKEAAKEAGATDTMSKKEALMFEREMDKLTKSIGGIKDMGGIPDAIFVVDVGYHKIAVTEAAKLGIPVIGVVDTNHSPEGIDYVIPGNDDSSKAVALYVRGVADAILEGRANAVQEVVEAARGGDDFVEVQEG